MRKPIETKDISEMTRQEFEDLPHRKWDEDIGEFSGLVIIPASNYKDSNNIEEFIDGATKRLMGEKPEYLHDSGFRFMSFVAEKYGHPICKLSGGSDVIHVGGIGGDNINNPTHSAIAIPKLIAPVAWSIDCLPKSGLLRLFSPSGKLRVGLDLSSFEVFAIKDKK